MEGFSVLTLKFALLFWERNFVFKVFVCSQMYAFLWRRVIMFKKKKTSNPSVAHHKNLILIHVFSRAYITEIFYKKQWSSWIGTFLRVSWSQVSWTQFVIQLIEAPTFTSNTAHSNSLVLSKEKGTTERWEHRSRLWQGQRGRD